MGNSMNGRSKRYRDAAALLLALMVCLAGYKGYLSWMKTDLYAKASAEQASGHALEAENLYQKAERISSFDYKNQEITAALNELRPLTELKRRLLSITEDVKAAAKVHDVPTLVKTYEAFQAAKAQYAGKDEASQQMFADTEAVYQVENKLTAAFDDSKAELMKSLDTSITKKTFDNDNAIAYLLQIPAVFFKDEKVKKQELTEKLKTYDQARLDVLFKKKSYEEVLNETLIIRKFYSTNGLQADWLQPLLETYVQNTLAALLKKNDLKTFIAYAQKYQGLKEFADTKSKVSTYIQTSMRTQFTRAEQLTAARKFEEALELYSVLDKYKDTNKEVQELQQRWLESDPVQLLRKAADANSKFTNVVNAKSMLGAAVTAAGIADNKTIVLARLGANQKIDKADAPFDSSLTVKSLQLSDKLSLRGLPVVLVEAAAKNRKSRFIAYEAEGSDMRKILDVEADSFTQERSGVLLVDNPTGEAAGQKATYEYRDGQYAFTKLKQDLLDIALTEMPKQKAGTTVRFQCSIHTVDGNTATVLLNNEIILLTGNFKFKPGAAIVTGTYTDKSKVNIGNPPEPITAYKMDVTALTQ